MIRLQTVKSHIIRILAIAALYAGLTMLCNLIEGSLSWGPVQVRLSEVLCVLALFTPDAIPGLGIGCAVANIANLEIAGLGHFGLFDYVFAIAVTVVSPFFAWRFRDRPVIAIAGPLVANVALVLLLRARFGTMGMLDVVFGSLASAIGAGLTWRWRDRPFVALAGPVLANALIVPAYLPLVVRGSGFYTIPLTNVSVEGSYLLMYLFGFLAVGIGEALVMYLLGYPVSRVLKHKLPAVS